MSYIITKSNGQTLITLQDGTLDTTKTSITLVGKNYPGYGTTINQNMVRMLENFANSSSPSSPLVGQLWYDSSNGRLNIYNGSGFKPHSATILSTGRPTTNASGDFWFKSDTGQLFVYNGTDYNLIGPTVSNSNILAANITATGVIHGSYGEFDNDLAVTGTVTAANFVSTTIPQGRILFTTSGGQFSSSSTLAYDAGSDTVSMNNVTITGTTSFGTVYFGAGAVGAPSISRTSDTDTGFWFPTLNTIAASTNGAERLRIDASGNIGIGTSSPGSALDVKGTIRLSGSSSGYVGLAPAAAAGSTTYTLPSADGLAGYALTTNGAGVTSWTSNPGYVGSRGVQGFVGSASTVAGPPGSAGSLGYTGSSGGGGGGGGYTGSLGPQGPQGAIGYYGSVGGLGYTGSGAAGGGSSVTLADDTSTNASRYVLFTNQTSGTLSSTYVSTTKLQYNPSNGTVTATDFSATSDAKFKTILGAISDPLNKVLSLRGVRYNWNALAAANGINDEREQVGVIAQEVEKILPQAVEQTNSHLSVKYDKLVPLLIEAVKQLSETVDQLKQQLNDKQ